MKYIINIHQAEVIKRGLNLSLKDLVVYNAIKDASNREIICLEEGAYYRIRWQDIIRALPILKITTKEGIMKHVRKLVKEGLIEMHPECQKYKMILFLFTEKSNGL